MGMYTELVMSAELKPDTPAEVIDALKTMLGEKDVDDSILPDHPLFATFRWDYMLQCSSYYFAPGFSQSSLVHDEIAKCHYLTIRCSLKNYDSEIEKFLKWIRPYLHTYGDSEFLGYYRYEESEHPTLIYSGGTKDMNTPAQVVRVEEESTVIRIKGRF